MDLTVPETCCFSWQGASISNSHLDLLLISPRPIAQRREAYIYNSKNERFFPVSIGQLHVNVGASKEALRMCTATAASARGRRRGFLSDRKYRYHPRTQADVADCWPWAEISRHALTDLRRKEPLSKHEFESRRVRVRQPNKKTGGMLDACTSACSGLTIDRSCSACNTASATSPTGLPEGFFVGLKDSVA